MGWNEMDGRRGSWGSVGHEVILPGRSKGGERDACGIWGGPAVLLKGCVTLITLVSKQCLYDSPPTCTVGITDVPASEGEGDHVGRRRDLEAVSRARQLLPGECVDPKSSSLTHMTTVRVSGMVPLPLDPASVKSYGFYEPQDPRHE